MSGFHILDNSLTTWNKPNRSGWHLFTQNPCMLSSMWKYGLFVCEKSPFTAPLHPLHFKYFIILLGKVANAQQILSGGIISMHRKSSSQLFRMCRRQVDAMWWHMCFQTLFFKRQFYRGRSFVATFRQFKKKSWSQQKFQVQTPFLSKWKPCCVLCYWAWLGDSLLTSNNLPWSLNKPWVLNEGKTKILLQNFFTLSDS